MSNLFPSSLTSRDCQNLPTLAKYRAGSTTTLHTSPATMLLSLSCSASTASLQDPYYSSSSSWFSEECGASASLVEQTLTLECSEQPLHNCTRLSSALRSP